MKKYLPFAVILIAVFVGSIFYFSNSKQENNISETQSHRSYELDVTSNTNNVKPNQPVTFMFRVKNDKGEILKNYETVHEKIMHFITVRKDLAYFQHLHPDFNQQSGEFTIFITFPTDGQYRIFLDFTPGDENPQKLPVTLFKDINAGEINKYNPQPLVIDSNASKTIDGYNITYKLNPRQPKAQSDFAFTLTIVRNGQPVTNLETYLGAMGHSVILKEGTLDFIHAHAGEMNMDNMSGMMMENTTGMGPDIKFAATFPEPGVYKIFTQFQHEGEVQTADYIIKIK